MTNNRFSDEDLERLVLGNEPDSQELSRLAEALHSWQAEFTRVPTDEQVAVFAKKAAEIAGQSRTEVPAQIAAAPTRSRLRALRYKLAAGMAAVLMLSGLTGVAAASDEAVPGDTLYGLDRALESVGFGDGGILERFEEAETLNERGNASAALSHAAEAIAQAGGDEEDIEEALTGLDQAITALTDRDFPGDTGEVRARVATMLSWMSGNGADMLNDADEPGAFGRAVADLARGISTEHEPTDAPGEADDVADAARDAAEEAREGGNEDPGPPDDVPAGPPGDTPPNRP